MKLGLTIFFSLIALGFGPTLSAQTHGELVPVSGDDLFIPQGFDDNDEAVFVVDGYLPSSCYRLTRPEVAIDESTGVVTVTPMARFFEVPCLEALVPFDFEVRLGVMPMGAFEVKIAGTEIKETLEVLEATNAGPDDYLYAPVDDVSIETDGAGNQRATLTGRFTNSCMTLGEVRVSHTGKTLQVQPIMDYDESNTCLAGIFPYKEQFSLPADLDNGRHLLHVRSLNGRDVNKLFTFTR